MVDKINGRQDIVSPSRPGSRTEGEDGEGGRQDRLQNLADRQMQRCNRFVALSKRSIVEWTFASISRNRRLARNFERGARSVAAFVRLAMKTDPLRMNPFFLDRLLGSEIKILFPRTCRQAFEQREAIYLPNPSSKSVFIEPVRTRSNR